MKKSGIQGVKARRKKYWLSNAMTFWFKKRKHRDASLWVFGGWEGNRYDDNSRYLFEHMNQAHPEIRAVWLTENDKIVETVRAFGYEAFNSSTKEGKEIQKKAGVYFYTNGYDDIANVPLVSGALVIGLWHGTGMKNVFYLLPHMQKKSFKSRLRDIKDKIFRYSYQDYAIATSDAVSKMRQATYRLKESQILITGQPRNDVFHRTCTKDSVLGCLENANDYRYILYMPTYRPYESEAVQQCIYDLAANEEFVGFLKEQHIRFILKLHYLTKIDKNVISDPFFIISNDDVENVQELLTVSDLMITDYSGCCIDFALTNKPILLYTPDFEEYNERVGLKTEWNSIYAEHGTDSSQILAQNLMAAMRMPEQYVKLNQAINELYENKEIAGTCYSENVYHAVMQLLQKQ